MSYAKGYDSYVDYEIEVNYSLHFNGIKWKKAE